MLRTRVRAWVGGREKKEREGEGEGEGEIRG